MSWGARIVGGIEFSSMGFKPGVNAMRLIGEAAKTAILVETQDKGTDQDGRPFKPYSKLYATVRQAAGYGIKPDLTVTGHMLNAMSVVSANANSVTIGFTDTQQSERRTLLSQAWPRLSESDRNAFWAIASASKRKAGKSKGTGRRRNPSTERGRSQGPIASGHPSPMPSEKMEMTNKLRPWFGFGKPNSRRRQLIQKRGARLIIKALTAQFRAGK